MRPLIFVVSWAAWILSTSIGSSLLPEAQNSRSMSHVALEARHAGVSGHVARWSGAEGRTLRENTGGGRASGFGGKIVRGMGLSLSLRGGNGGNPYTVWQHPTVALQISKVLVDPQSLAIL